MTVSIATQVGARRLPPALMAAQAAIHVPEVREMLRRLSEYNLGIFMPHMHDEATGDFQLLPDHLLQVESGLEVSFHARREIASLPARFLPVGWVWHGGAATPAAACEMVDEEIQGGTERSVKHKMTE